MPLPPVDGKIKLNKTTKEVIKSNIKLLFMVRVRSGNFRTGIFVSFVNDI